MRKFAKPDSRYCLSALASALIIGMVAFAAADAQKAPGLAIGGGLDASRTRVDGDAASAPIPLKIKLPFPDGASYEVIQGNHGTYTHSGFNIYAWDFQMPEGDPVCAAAAGRVVRVKQNGSAGGPSKKFFHDGNAIIIDHGSGYFSHYLHLAPDSAKVREGDHVSGGQVIALSGNTGFSSTPHLHFHIQDASGRSLPVAFQDVPGTGIPVKGQNVTSANNGTGTTHYAGESYLPVDIFDKNSILLITRNLPGHLYRAGREYPIKGRLNQSDARRVAVYFMSAKGGPALHTIYATVDRDGFFETAFKPEHLKPEAPDWNPSTDQSNLFSLAITPVNPDGSFWSDVSVPVCVR